MLSVPGIGLLPASALVAATSGDVSHFKDARHFTSWFGLTPRVQRRRQPVSQLPNGQAEALAQLDVERARREAGPLMKT